MRRALVLLAGAALVACTMVKLKDESASFYASTALVGRVTGPAPDGAPLIVAAYAMHDGRPEIAHRARLHEAGPYELVVPAGQFALFAFADLNGNLRYDAGEPAGDYADGRLVAATGEGVISQLDILLGPGATRVPPGTSFAPPDGKVLHDTQAGAPAHLDEAMYSPESASMGYWAPMAFYREFGGNVVFAEPYDPGRTPVLFVHGASGSPRDLRALAEGIDRGRFQVWYYYYPSGASLESMAHLLYWKLYNLQASYGFQRMHVVAHSMGGLVVREFLVDNGANFPYVDLFVSISTPWGGESLAALGVRASPAVIPSWRDMQPQGMFLQTLFRKPLPGGVRYYLMFGHRGGGSLFRPNNDGTVTLASQLAPSAQREARMVYGYDEDHISVLGSPSVRAQLGALLSAAGAPAVAEGSVKLLFSYAPAPPGPRAQPLLVLTPADSPGPPVSSLINPEDSGRTVGPYPAGTYDARLAAYGFRTLPALIPLTVGEGRSTTLGFRLEPQGVLAGYVAARRTDSPAGTYYSPHSNIRVRSVMLDGKGLRRSLEPAGDGANVVEEYLAGRDQAFGTYFSFVGLPPGDYALTIRADGYRTHTSTHRVVPGEAAASKPILLEPLP